MSDLSELFDRDPLHLTNEDTDKIIARLREHQAQFELGAKVAPAKAASRPKTTKTLDLLKDLGLT